MGNLNDPAYAALLCDLADWTFEGGWARPMDLGGSSGSSHSYRLRNLAAVGLVESRQRGTLNNLLAGSAGQAEPAPGTRGSRRYKITEAGRRQLAEWTTARAAPEAPEEVSDAE
jgi:hypothetical protein